MVGKSDIRAFGRRWSLVVSGGLRFGDIGRRVYLIDDAPGTHPFLHVESGVEREIRQLNEINEIQHERFAQAIRPIADAADAACPACATALSRRQPRPHAPDPAALAGAVEDLNDAHL